MLKALTPWSIGGPFSSRAEGEPDPDGLGPEAGADELAEERLADAQRLRPRPHLLGPAAGRAGHGGQPHQGGGGEAAGPGG